MEKNCSNSSMAMYYYNARMPAHKNTKYIICSMENMPENRTQDESIGSLSFPA